MYTIINEKKIIVESTNNDSNILNLTLNSEYGMQGTYDLFKDNDLTEIKIFDDNDEVINIFNGYTKIDSYFYNPSSNLYTISLLKIDPNLFQSQLETLHEKVNDINMNIETVEKSANDASVDILSLKEHQERTEQAIQDLILATLSM